jgi:hypothetical protein
MGRFLVVDRAHGPLAYALAPAMSRHDVDFARDAVEVIHKIDCADPGYDLVLSDAVLGELPGPELRAYLALTRRRAAESVVYVISAPLSPQRRALVQRVPSMCVALPIGGECLDALMRGRERLRAADAALFGRSAT